MAKKKPKYVKLIPKANPAPQPTPRPKPPPVGIVRLFREFRDLGLVDDLIERSEVIWTLVGLLPAQVLADLDPAMAKKVIYGTSAKAAHLNAWLLIDPGKRRARLTGACKARSQIVAQEAVKLLDRLLQTTPLLELRKLGLQPNQDAVILEALSRLHQTTTRKKALEIQRPEERTLGSATKPIASGGTRQVADSKASPGLSTKRLYSKLVPSIDPYHDD